LYPNGDKLANKDYLSVYVELVSCRKKNVCAKFKFSVIDANQEEKNVIG